MGKYIKLFDSHQAYEDFIKSEDFILPNVSLCVKERGVHYTPKLTEYDKKYFTIESLEDNNTISIQNVNQSNLRTFYYSTDSGKNWTGIAPAQDTTESITTLDSGKKVIVKCTTNNIGNVKSYFTFTGNKDFKVYGNIMSLLRGDNFVSSPELPGTVYHFHKLFYNVTTLIDAENLILPATTLKQDCYNSMFKGCTSLVNAPKILPATTLAQSCYISMFSGCISLVTTPQLPATTLATYCYTNMFEGCTSLIEAPELPATTLAGNCYDLMFRDCTSLTIAPELPALTLAKSCYSSMFRGCISLAEAPELPATTLADYCYNRMFQMSDSEKLLTPAMTKAPILSATNVVSNCYSEMFKGNGNLNEVTCLTENPGDSKSTNWLQYASPTGTFIKSPLANWNRNNSGIPTGWTAYTDELTSISILGIPITELTGTAYKISTVPSDSYYRDATWSVLSGNALISQDGVLTPLEEGEVTIQAVSTYDSSIVATKTITVQNNVGYEYKYFTIESLADDNPITIQNVNCEILPTFSYSLDSGETWSSVTMTKNRTKSIATINNGDKVIFKSTNASIATEYNQINKFNGSKNFKVYGNVMSLLWGDDFEANVEFESSSSKNLEGLFSGSTTLIDASNLILPALNANDSCYNGMFRACTNLTTAPKLPALIMGSSCYSSMFEGCVSLVEAPELPAMTLNTSCYQRMFCMSRTTTLTTPAMVKGPVLPAAKLANTCYSEMFRGNGNLTEVTCLATNTSAYNCTLNWLQYVSSTGTFKKDETMTGWSTGTSGIPSGWTVVTADS